MTAARALTRYRGPLTIEQVAAGMNAATANARRLAQDARTTRQRTVSYSSVPEAEPSTPALQEAA
jgi:hypothetical protein